MYVSKKWFSDIQFLAVPPMYVTGSIKFTHKIVYMYLSFKSYPRVIALLLKNFHVMRRFFFVKITQMTLDHHKVTYLKIIKMSPKVS